MSTDTYPHPHPNPHPHHRKIDLQSPADLSYLLTNVRNAASQKLNLHLPPSAATSTNPTDDPMRERVRELVDEFIDTTFATASHSISINGLDASTLLPPPSSMQPPEEEFETYSPSLASKLSSLYATLESLTTTVAQLRREAPGKAARNYAEALRGAMEEDHRGFEGGEVLVIGEADAKLDVKEPERWDEVREMWGIGVGGLVRLQGGGGGSSGDAQGGTGAGLTETVGRVERARKAVEVVEGMMAR